MRGRRRLPCVRVWEGWLVGSGRRAGHFQCCSPPHHQGLPAIPAVSQNPPALPCRPGVLQVAGGVTIVYNGTTYNFGEILDSLSLAVFNTTSPA